MSVLEQLEGFERSILERLRELAPLVREYQELRAVAERLGLDPGPDAPLLAPAQRTNGGPPSEPRQRRLRRPGPERRQDQVLELIRRRPGITVADVARELGVDPTSLYRIVRRLEASGRIVKDGRRLHPRSSQ